jgi:glycosyltransferase involved in cell wall biosynthesis
MSNNVSSGIFNSIIGYFKKYLPENYELFVTEFPLDNMDVYHYHRPNLEQKLLKNSVVTVHHDLEDTDPWFCASQFIQRYHEAKHVICLNSRQKYILHKTERLFNCSIIPHAVNKDIFYQTKRTYKENKKLVLGIVSKRYGRRVKGEALMHELYKRLDNKYIKFYFIGEGRGRDQIEAESFGFEVDSYESLPYKLFNQLYQKLDILLVPSLFEGGPANIPEALFTKTPILARNIAMASDVMIEGVNGYFLSGIPQKDAQLINDLANNKNNLMSNLIEQINKSSPDVMMWQDVVSAHDEIYKKIVNKVEV